MPKGYKPKQKKQKGGAEFTAKPGNPVKDEMPASLLLNKTLYADEQSILEHAKSFSQVALVVIGRGGGEGYDLEPGDLRLLDSERKLLEIVCSGFEKVILVLNTVNTIEMGWLNDFTSVKSVLWAGFTGISGTKALGDILNGKVNPSGHLPDTWLADHMKNPATNNFNQMNEKSGWEKDSFHYVNAPKEKGYFVKYSEGIYMGYRYFETRDISDDSFDYKKTVVWPFGYGISYSSFIQKITKFSKTDSNIELTVSVTNTGNFAGKDVIQIYGTPPYDGRIEKSEVNLISFRKTNQIKPKERDEQKIFIELKDC